MTFHVILVEEGSVRWTLVGRTEGRRGPGDLRLDAPESVHREGNRGLRM